MSPNVTEKLKPLRNARLCQCLHLACRRACCTLIHTGAAGVRLRDWISSGFVRGSRVTALCILILARGPPERALRTAGKHGHSGRPVVQSHALIVVRWRAPKLQWTGRYAGMA